MNKQNSFGNYKKIRDSYNLEIPEFYNFGFDVIEKRALEDDKTAFIYVSRDGSKIENHKFSDLNNDSNRFANVLCQLGIKKVTLLL